MSDCPSLYASGEFRFDHPFHVRVHAVGNRIVVEACEGMAYRPGFFGGVGPWYRSTKYQWRARRFVRKCQAWCDRENAKTVQAAAKTEALLQEAGIVTHVDAERLLRGPHP